ncbi:hypothetical protein OAH77_06325 [Flavobacteriaceae bacterium]|nr:hypothetical protein [Flavobacteriaceae bacterium]
MGRLNFTRKSFLDQQELNRFQDFLVDNVVTNAIIGNTTNFGIIRTNFTGDDPNFRISVGTQAGTIQSSNPESSAIDRDGNLIVLNATDNITVRNDSNYYWVRISHIFNGMEPGTLSINREGRVTGTDTQFTQFLRDQSDNQPCSVVFYDSQGGLYLGGAIYEVVEIVSDTVMYISVVRPTIPESNLRYVILGSLPIGESVSRQRYEGVYRLDSCNVELVRETIINTPPVLAEDQIDRFFYIARVRNQSGAVTVETTLDRGNLYWNFNLGDFDGSLLALNNLSELTATSNIVRTNLDIYSRSETINAISALPSRWESQLNLYLSTAQNLSDVTDPEDAAENIGAISTSGLNNLLGNIDTDINRALNFTTYTDSFSRTQQGDDGIQLLGTRRIDFVNPEENNNYTVIPIVTRVNTEPTANQSAVFNLPIIINKSRVSFEYYYRVWLFRENLTLNIDLTFFVIT